MGEVADALRRALASGQTDDVDVGYFADLTRWLEMSDMSRRDECVEVVGQKWQYKIAVLLRSCLWASELRTVSDLRVSFRHAIMCGMPAMWCDALMSLVDSVQLPRRTALYDRRLTMHIGFLQSLRETHAYMHRSAQSKDQKGKGPFVMLCCDSSPQGGRDWLLGLRCETDYED